MSFPILSCSHLVALGLSLSLSLGISSSAMADSDDNGLGIQALMLATFCLHQDDNYAQLPLGKSLMRDEGFKESLGGTNAGFNQCMKRRKPLPDAFCTKLLSINALEDYPSVAAKLDKDLPASRTNIERTIQECGNTPPAKKKR